ncbi:MAG: hypothetical protein M0D57_11340 [Sphingobacteriales bacterium JAD_PAG50586_3]|nr:MAG: hypothetical protein M0D57_11340 [Sphingobacteriales bacterium JAD_PAG50586_3]
MLAIIPVLVTPWATLQWQYNSWFTMLQADHAASLGLSVAGGLEAWFGATPNKMLITIAGVGLFCLTYLNIKAWQQPGFKLLLLASALIWTVIFNHKAESPTFIIAVAGIVIWYFSQKQSTFNLVLLVLVFVFTCLSPTDLFPRAIRTDIIIPYQLKVLPCILVWLKIVYDQLTYKPLNFATNETDIIDRGR